MLIEAELTAIIGAGLHERSESRTTQHMATAHAPCPRRRGDVELAIPKTRTGSLLRSLLEPHRQVDRALWALIM